MAISLRGRILEIVLMATAGAWVLGILSALAATTLVVLITGHGGMIIILVLNIFMVGGLATWLPFAVTYLPLTLLLRGKFGGWRKTQNIVIAIACFVVFALTIAYLVKLIAEGETFTGPLP